MRLLISDIFRFSAKVTIYAGVILTGFPAIAEQPFFSLPIDCIPGRSCFLQNYVDIDSSDRSFDYRCGGATYNGHKGTDFRLLSLKDAEKGIAVLAAAAGEVVSYRNHMADRLMTPENRFLIDGKECGNGVVIDHGEGWVTQYCHMRRGSIRVSKGQTVERGYKLGDVGYSGFTQFAHLHFSVRHKRKPVDPFTGMGIGEACLTDGQEPQRSLWKPEVLEKFPYIEGQIIEAGFAGRPMSKEDLEMGTLVKASPSATALVFFARLINLKQADHLILSVRGPNGFVAGNKTRPFDRHRATQVVYSGKKLRSDRWPPGEYIGQIELVRDERTIRKLERRLTFE